MEPLLQNWWVIPISLTMILVGVRWCITKKIKRSAYPFSEQYHYITGTPVFFCGLIAIAGGVMVLLVNTEFMQVDRCLDLGGKYDYESHTCIYAGKNL